MSIHTQLKSKNPETGSFNKGDAGGHSEEVRTKMMTLDLKMKKVMLAFKAKEVRTTMTTIDLKI